MTKRDEKVLVVNRNIIFKNHYWQGLKTNDLDYYLGLIRKNYQFKKRILVENNPDWQQIIPYILFNFEDKYFLYYYLKKASEKRLKNDYLLGIGGHINPIDLKTGQDVLEAGTIREWQEEVEYRGNLIEKKLIGILNDDSREVEAVHLGLVYLFRGDSPEISVKEKDILKGEMVSLKDLKKYLKDTQGWAPIVYQEYLLKFPK